VFDVSNPDRIQLAQDAGERNPVMRVPVMRVNDPKRGKIVLEERATYDAASGIRNLPSAIPSRARDPYRIETH
jgi:hypothetical protein